MSMHLLLRTACQPNKMRLGKLVRCLTFSRIDTSILNSHVDIHIKKTETHIINMTLYYLHYTSTACDICIYSIHMYHRSIVLGVHSHTWTSHKFTTGRVLSVTQHLFVPCFGRWQGACLAATR